MLSPEASEQTASPREEPAVCGVCVAYCVSGKWCPKQVALRQSGPEKSPGGTMQIFHANTIIVNIQQFYLRDVLNLNLSKIAPTPPPSIESS